MPEIVSDKALRRIVVASLVMMLGLNVVLAYQINSKLKIDTGSILITLEERMDKVEARLDAIEGRLVGVDEKINNLLQAAK